VVDAAPSAGSGGAPLPLKDGGLPSGFDASFIDASLVGSEDLEKCDCTVPGKRSTPGLSVWVLLTLLGLIVTRRKAASS
jgi:hypothetical protein